MSLGLRPKLFPSLVCLAALACSTKHVSASSRQSGINSGNILGAGNSVDGPGSMSPAPSILDAKGQDQENKLFPPTPGTLAGRRLWRLTVPQLGNTVRTLLSSSDAIEAKFDAETRPTSGLGIESDILGINSDYASVLETVIGPIMQASTTALATYLPCGSAAAINPSCLDSFISAFGAKAFRRPLTDAEVKRYEGLYNAVQPGSSNADALAAVADAIVRSPYTQFRAELGAPTNDPSALALSPTELATALAYSITNGPPDQDLMAAAASGDLNKADVLAANAKRLMSSSGFVNGFTEFFMRYSGVAWIGSMPKDAKLFPQYNADVMNAMVDETKAYVQDVMIGQKGDFHALMANKATTVTPALASIYQIPTFNGSQQITPPATQRAGFFTLPAVIAANTKSADTSPVKRGVFLLNSLVCVSPLPPPPNVPSLAPNVDASATLRARFAAHVASPTCAGCHNLIDPFGFALENYDPIGRYRTVDNGTPVDASGTVSGTMFSNAPFTSAVDLFKTLSTSPDVYSCLVKNAFRYTFGRPETAGDAPALRSAYEHFVVSNLDINQIFISFYSSYVFQYRKAN